MLTIQSVYGSEILDSRGTPTVSATVRLSDGSCGYAAVPSGASTGKYEAVELRDGDSRRYCGKGVLGAVKNIDKKIGPEIQKISNPTVAKVDEAMLELDGTGNKERLGANATLAVSLACARALAAHHGEPLYRFLGGAAAVELPTPMMNILNGGAHAGNNIDIQEFMIMPVGVATFREKLRCCCEVYAALKELLKFEGLSTAVGDEGGFAPDLSSDEEGIEIILTAAEKAGYKDEIKLALDAAGSEWAKEDGSYMLPKRGSKFTSAELCGYWERIVSEYPVISLEDPLGEEDFGGFTRLTESVGGRVQIVGDDLFVTSAERLRTGIELSAANAILVKLNQIGTLSETLRTIELAKKNGYRTIISHRSGETEDSFIADLAVAVNAGQIKTGAPCRSERVAKYNRLLKIEDGM